MKPKEHTKRLLKIMTALREEVCVLVEHKHVQSCGYKSLHDVELDIETLTQEIEKMELLKGK